MGEDNEVNEIINTFHKELKLGKLVSSHAKATAAVHTIRKIITQAQWDTAEEIIQILKSAAKKLCVSSIDSCVGNMFRHVLKLIRDEYAAHIKLSKTVAGVGGMDIRLESLISVPDDSDGDAATVPIPELKSAVLDNIAETLLELEVSVRNVAVQALEHIHVSEVIMTIGASKYVEAFLKEAARKRKFTVIVCETAPFYTGQELAAGLAKENIETTLITDAAIFALMSRVNKVIIGTDRVLANGGLMAVSGTHALALAAKHHSVPLMVLAPMFKLSPQFPSPTDLNPLNDFKSPESVLSFSEASLVAHTEVINPLYDYVPPELVTLFVSNVGGNSPSYIYRLVNELYHPHDIQL